MPKVRFGTDDGTRENLSSVRNSKKLLSCTDLGRMLEIRDNVLNHFVDALWRKQFVHTLGSNDTWGAALTEKLSILELFAIIPATPLVLKYTAFGWFSGSHRCCTPLLSPHFYRRQTLRWMVQVCKLDYIYYPPPRNRHVLISHRCGMVSIVGWAVPSRLWSMYGREQISLIMLKRRPRPLHLFVECVIWPRPHEVRTLSSTLLLTCDSSSSEPMQTNSFPYAPKNQTVEGPYTEELITVCSLTWATCVVMGEVFVIPLLYKLRKVENDSRVRILLHRPLKSSVPS